MQMFEQGDSSNRQKMKIKFSGTRKSVLLKASSGERCTPANFVLFVTLEGAHVRLIVYLAVHQIK